jgi:hypothetical protein
MSDYSWPADIVPHQQTFFLQPHTGGSQSPFSRQSKIYVLSKPLWLCRMSLRAPPSAERWRGGPAAWGERIDAFLAQIQGRANRVELWDFRRPGKARPFTNAPVLAGTKTMTLIGAAPGSIRVGEYIGGDGRPHIITALETSGDDLVATVAPHFAIDIEAGAATFVRASGFFRLETDDAGHNPTEVGSLTTYGLDFIEDPGPSADIIYESETVTYSG